MTNGIPKIRISLSESTMALKTGFHGHSRTPAYFDSDPHSPTDSSEDSVEVKITPIQNKNKRKSAEPRKTIEPSQHLFTGPLKKRMCLQLKTEPFRPWSPTPPQSSSGYFRPPSPYHPQTEPIPLIKKIKLERVPQHPEATCSTQETEAILKTSSETFPGLNARREQRNYKNMTRERRIEANARERTRVHTISAAFDTLRKSIPSYSNVQKLSKLSVLRIACSYIMTLSNIVDEDDEATAEGVDMVSKTIQREGKLRKKKDDND